MNKKYIFVIIKFKVMEENIEKEVENQESAESGKEETQNEFTGFGYLGTTFNVLSWISIAGAFILLLQYCNASGEGGNNMLIGICFSSFLVLQFFSGIVKVLIQIEKNTRK